MDLSKTKLDWFDDETPNHGDRDRWVKMDDTIEILWDYIPHDMTLDEAIDDFVKGYRFPKGYVGRWVEYDAAIMDGGMQVECQQVLLFNNDYVNEKYVSARIYQMENGSWWANVRDGRGIEWDEWLCIDIRGNTVKGADRKKAEAEVARMFPNAVLEPEVAVRRRCARSEVPVRLRRG